MKEKNPLDEYFKQGLEGHEIKPSASVWEKIEAETQLTGSRKAGGWYLMRAAVVTVLLGLSTWVFYQNRDFSTNPNTGVVVEQDKTVAHSDKDADEQKGDKRKQGTSPEPSSEKQAAPKKQNKKDDEVIPIMKKPGKSSTIFVSHDEMLSETVDEARLEREAESWAMEQVALNVPVESQEKLVPIKVKVKLTPATTPAFYNDKMADADQKESGFKEKLYAYANNQFDNLISGKPLELPKAEKKPQLEINLGRIFNR